MKNIALTLTSLIVLLALAAMANPATAQEMETTEPEMREGVTYYSAWHVKFKPGMADEALELIYDHFWPIDKVIGREVIPFDHLTGKWDHSVYFPLEGGPSDLAYETVPSESQWFAALAEQEGGMESAQALMERFSGLIAESNTELVMSKWSPGE